MTFLVFCTSRGYYSEKTVVGVGELMVFVRVLQVLGLHGGMGKTAIRRAISVFTRRRLMRIAHLPQPLRLHGAAIQV